ncbi:MAG TPA: hypothetical protein VGN17_00370 [Bryobacteraceae bacterium]|jgi:hypothetical protein
MLKYLFEAHFKDGSVIQQTQGDVSATDPTKSAFYDVLQRQDDLKAFGLFSDESPNTYAVSLETGVFEINGIPFAVQDPSRPVPEDVQKRIVYFRRVTRHFTGDLTECAVDMLFHIGFQCTDASGKNHQYTIAVE